MRDSLSSRATLFEGLRLHQVRSFLYVINQSDLKNIEHVKRRYLEKADSFDITFQFLSEIDAIKIENNQLYAETSCIQHLSDVSKNNFIRELLAQLINGKNEYRSELFSYLSHFEVFGEAVVYRPDSQSRGIQSGVRNFLMELGVVYYDKDNDWYIISPKEYNLFATAKNDCTVTTPSAFKANQQAKEDLGHAAELAVLSYEKRRLGKELAHFVEHVAARNVAAGYDIDSISLNSEGVMSPRYIEVKAISSSRISFYWTANERKTAKMFKSWYYLYLLPVSGNSKFDFDGLRIVRDPYISVLSPDSDWVIDNNVIFCHLADQVSDI